MISCSEIIPNTSNEINIALSKLNPTSILLNSRQICETEALIRRFRYAFGPYVELGFSSGHMASETIIAPRHPPSHPVFETDLLPYIDRSGGSNPAIQPLPKK